MGYDLLLTHCAGVVKLADTHRSGRCAGNRVEVQVLSPAPFSSIAIAPPDGYVWRGLFVDSSNTWSLKVVYDAEDFKWFAGLRGRDVLSPFGWLVAGRDWVCYGEWTAILSLTGDLL